MPIDPSVAEAVNELEDDEPEDDEETDESEATAAPTEPVPPPAPAPNRGGRPKGSRNRPKAPGTGFAEARLPGTPTPAIESLPTPAKGRPPLDKTMQQTWDDLVDELRQKGYSPSYVTIAVRRFALGAQRTEPQDLNPIPGQVVGGESEDGPTPGEELYDHLVRAYHIPLNAGPSRYRLWFYLKGAQKSHMGTADVHMPAAVEVRRMIAAQDEARREQERAQALAGEPPPPRRAHRPLHPDDPPYLGEDHGPMGGYTPPYRPQPQVPQVIVPPIAPAMDPMMKPLFEAWQAQAIAAIQRGMQPPPMPQTVSQPQGLTREDVASTVIETLRATGLLPMAGATKPLTPERVQESVASPMSAAKQFFAQFREFKQMEREMEDMFGPDDEPAAQPAAPIPVVATVISKPDAPDDEFELKPVGGAFQGAITQQMGAPILYAPKKATETTFEWLMRLAGGNPVIAQKMMGKAAEMGMQFIDKAGLAKLVGAAVQNAIPAGAHQTAGGHVVEAPTQQNGASNFKPDFS